MKLQPFRTQYRNHDFTLISETIKKYYPVEQEKRAASINEWAGFRKIGELIKSEYLDKEKYDRKWGQLISDLKHTFQIPINGHPNISWGGGFMGELVVSKDEQPDFIREKSICFQISILGPFFSIFGVDSSTAILDIDSVSHRPTTGNFRVTHAITVSPVFEYKDIFDKVEEELRSCFPGYLFIPYQIGMSTIKNISLIDELRDSQMMDTVYEGLFGHSAVHSCLTRGDERYGMKDWIRPFSKQENELLQIIFQHILTTPVGVTIHKVWKHQESKRLNSLTTTGNVMFGVESFDLMDLTDEKSAITTSGERGTPSKSEYGIKDNLIWFSEICTFRIITLSEDLLVVNLILDVEDNDTSIKGEAYEMKFISMKKL